MEWISIADSEIPYDHEEYIDDLGWVLIYHNHAFYFPKIFVGRRGYYGIESAIGDRYISLDLQNHITHWMPLLSPP